MPGSGCTELVAPAYFGARERLSFAAPANHTLAANTTYAVVLSGYDVLHLAPTISDAEDTPAAPGWSIANGYRLSESGRWPPHCLYHKIPLAIRGLATSGQQAVEPPAITGAPSVSEAGADGQWTPGETVQATVTFSEAVTVDTSGGIPAIAVMLGGTQPRSADYKKGSGTEELVFAYTLGESDGDHPTMGVAPDSLALNGGSITSEATGVDADLSHVGTVIMGTRDGGRGVRKVPERTGPTASFSDLPATHDGKKPFKVKLSFSEEPDLSYKTVRGASRVTKGNNREWKVTVKPSQGYDIALALPVRGCPVRGCDETGAVCVGGRPLAGPASATIPGKPLTASLTGPAEHDGSESFTVRLTFSMEPDVSYKTVRDTMFTEKGGAISGAKRVKPPHDLEFDITVEPDGDGAVSLSLASPLPACGETGAVCTAAGRKIEGTVDTTIPGPVAISVADASVREAAGAALVFVVMLDRARSEAVTVDYATVRETGAGVATENSDYTATSGTTPLDAAAPLAPQDWLAEHLAQGPDAHRPEERTLTAQDLLLGSSFHLVSQADDNGGTAFSAWGRVSTGGFQAEADDLTLDGDVTTGLLGFDAEWKRLLAGLVLAHSEGDGGYNLRGGERGSIKSSLTGVYPYARLRLSDRVLLWALAGAGSGDLTLVWQDEAIDTGLDMRLGALGVTGTLLAGGGFDLAVKSDALWVRTESDAAAGLEAATAQVSRLRLILEAGRTFALASGAVLAPTAQIGLRHDGGDAETGTGVEVGAGIRYTAGMLTIEGQVRTLLAHEAGGYEEWGASGSIRLSPNASGLGPSLAVLPSWGAAGSAVATLWSHPDASALASGSALASPPGRLDAELGWGLPALRGRGVLTPYARVALVVCHVSIFGYGHLNLVDASCAANCQTPTPRARKLRCDATLVVRQSLITG